MIYFETQLYGNLVGLLLWVILTSSDWSIWGRFQPLRGTSIRTHSYVRKEFVLATYRSDF